MEHHARHATATPLPRIRAVTPLSLCDWPGRSAAVLYLGGCNLRCPTCHNASLAFTPSRHPALDASAVLKGLAARARWLDGVVVCGGEPTLDPGLFPLVQALDALGPPVKVDTNGMAPDVVERLFEACPRTCFAVDVKGPWEKYPVLTGGAASPEAARERLEAVFALAARDPARFRFRITLVPELTPDDVSAARRQLPPCFTLNEQTYLPPPAGKETAHALADPEARRLPGNLVPGAHRPGHPESPQGQRRAGPAALQAPGAQG
ncbi:radical SAM protein [Fundidesulfovibrio magnetotacticus]|uniref:radical SAM protein n=1 Tax=Fundidesulfovibrio magnetotacticus TaxID=2730080 RepID=UPI001F15AB77|nr:radical SAM protein [Fundidesulfovibrio magnetotacticus]